MMVQVRCTDGCYFWLNAGELKVSASGRLYGTIGYNIFVVDEVLNYASVN